MKQLVIILFFLIPVLGFSYDEVAIHQKSNDVEGGVLGSSNKVLPSEKTYNDFSDVLGEKGTETLRSGGSVPGGGNSNSGVEGTPIGDVAFLPMLILAVLYGLYQRKVKKPQDN